ncbi:SRPBCC domain-containing protein [Microlunatus speluncae]|uniref:SRPBCC domain-containing protein n=1 Tax=Microlunatus speluncae TaxID=2594267 RepID=UPI00126686C4|nr:SRPBCC domain-containing protein [Microlunatus speluncae]
MNLDQLFDRSASRTATGFDQTFRHRYRTTIDDLWAALTTPDRIGRWLGPVAERSADGSTYLINIGSGESLAPARIVIRHCAEPTELIVDWEWQGQPAARVSATLRSIDHDQVELTLRHGGVSSESLVVGYGGGWEWCLLALGVEAGAESWTAEQLDDHERAAQDAWRRTLEGID